ncbi:MAG: hypothetical protein CVT59_08090 [Actinobacteria bacterium HGW-Actinobacteria-1]|jgi:hypothetical protein|nr:MAG: hypothetical protein CVT59_08090 [Actinobacteria bacterium HGW-Actinobacteria-1]
MTVSDQVPLCEDVVGVLHRLCDVAFGPSGFTMLTVIEGARTRVVVSQCGSTAMDASAFTRATFVLQHAKIEALSDLGVSVGDLATAAFRDLLDQLASVAPNKVEFMRAVQSRMSAARIAAAR